KITSKHGTYADMERVIQLIGTGIGKKTIESFKKWCFKKNFALNEALVNVRRFPVHGMNKSSQLKLDEFLIYILGLETEMEQMSVEQRLIYLKENVKKIEVIITGNNNTKEIYSKLKEISLKYENNVSEFFKMISLQEDIDTYEFKDEKVALMTMHAAKGLEFPVVFVAGC
ncbi:MAG: ATP-dependent helicase, partial [archaeon]|nr:ATP-dependent helicase [archaeon]